MRRVLLAALLPLACTRAPEAGLPQPAPQPSSVPSSAASVPAPPSPSALPSPAEVKPGEMDARFVADLQGAFTAYKSWGRVGDELRWAPWLCRLPEPAKPLPSAAEDGEHSRKLYSLFAKEHLAYVTLAGTAPRASQEQVVVKESYVPEPVTGPMPPLRGMPRDLDRQPGDEDHFYPYSRTKDGTVVRAGSVAGLFVILEKPRGTPGTDDGFVYGTLTPEGEVTSAGKVASCMGCHVQAPHRRWFGSPGR